MSNSRMFYVYSFHHHADDLHRRLAGKFLVDENDQIHVLEDHSGLLQGLEDGEPDYVARRLQSLQDSSHTEIVDVNDIAVGNRPDLLEKVPGPAEPDQAVATKYSYHRIGMNRAQTLIFDENGHATLDGYILSDIELGRMLENVKSQKASLSKEPTEDGMVKFEQFYHVLRKSDPELSGALSHVRAAVKAGVLPDDVLRTLTGHIFKDTMIPSMGNKKAYQDFLSRPRSGVHIHLDANDFGIINKIHGFDTGDQAIKAYGSAIRNAMDESVGRANGKLFRVGGDEIVAHVPSFEHAARFVRTIKKHFDKLPPVKGTHNISASIGVGETPETAEHGLIQAKTAKKSAGYKVGQAKTHAYSAMPQAPGHLPTE